MTQQRATGTLTGNSSQVPDTFRKKIENFSFLMSERIGRGFSSTVYRGMNELSNEVVAIKVIDLKSLRDDIAKNMLDSELECIKSLNHPNLLRCYATFTTLNNCYIITEYCNDGDLASKLKAHGKFTQEEFKPLFRQIYQGYCRMNQQGYLHRDLKPANILLKNGIIKIADFGFVKKQTGSVKESYNVGTPLYMSPEAMKENIYTTKNDIWSLGVMSYQLLAGKAPWDCRNEAELKDKVARNCIRFDSLNVSSELKDLLQKCLEINETRRISLEEIDRHPWVRKLVNAVYVDTTVSPTPPIQNEFKSLTMTDGSLNRVASYNQQRYVKPFETVENPEAYELLPASTISVLEVLVSMLNFCRFNFTVQKKLKQCTGIHYKTEELLAYLQSDLLTKMKLHDYIIRTKDNIVQSCNWSEFVEGDDWEKYRSVVETYSQRYKLREIQLKRDGKLKDLLKEFIRDMNIVMEFQESIRSERNIVVLDYLVTYYLLADMWDQLSGNYYAFALYSQVDQICSGKVDESLIKKHEVYGKLRQKIAALSI